MKRVIEKNKNKNKNKTEKKPSLHIRRPISITRTKVTMGLYRKGGVSGKK